jgi:hypothetical protein
MEIIMYNPAIMKQAKQLMQQLVTNKDSIYNKTGD